MRLVRWLVAPILAVAVVKPAAHGAATCAVRSERRMPRHYATNRGSGRHFPNLLYLLARPVNAVIGERRVNAGAFGMIALAPGIQAKQHHELAQRRQIGHL